MNSAKIQARIGTNNHRIYRNTKKSSSADYRAQNELRRVFSHSNKRVARVMDELGWSLRNAEGAILLDRKDCEILLDWWDLWRSIPAGRKDLLVPRPRGRPEPTPMIDYMEVEQERAKMAVEAGKERGSFKRLTEAMAIRWKSTEDTARKRIVAARNVMGKQKSK